MLKQQRIPQTLLFAGPRGIGKHKVGAYFAKSLFCLSDTRPCGECVHCQKFENGAIIDYVLLAPDDSGKIKVGDFDEPGTVRHFVHRLTEKPLSKTMVALIDGIDLISDAGQNILLKTIEEPGENVYIIMIASSKRRLLETVLSRAVVLDFYPLSYDDLARVMNFVPESNSLEDLAMVASGGSAELTAFLLNDEFVLKVVDLGERIKGAIVNGDPFDFDSKEFDQIPDGMSIFDILIYLFHYNFTLVAASAVKYNRYLEKLYIDDIETLHMLIKKLQECSKGVRYNLNLRYAMYGLVNELSKNISWKRISV